MHIERQIPPSASDAKVVSDGLSHEDFQAKGFGPHEHFGLFIKAEGKVVAGPTGFHYFGATYIDTLWIERDYRKQGLGTQLMREAEKCAQENGCAFVHLTTMDWEGLSFYQKLGYSLEFQRDGYAKNSTRFYLRKDL